MLAAAPRAAWCATSAPRSVLGEDVAVQQQERLVDASARREPCGPGRAERLRLHAYSRPGRTPSRRRRRSAPRGVGKVPAGEHRTIDRRPQRAGRTDRRAAGRSTSISIGFGVAGQRPQARPGPPDENDCVHSRPRRRRRGSPMPSSGKPAARRRDRVEQVPPVDDHRRRPMRSRSVPSSTGAANSGHSVTITTRPRPSQPPPRTRRARPRAAAIPARRAIAGSKARHRGALGDAAARRARCWMPLACRWYRA